MLDLLLQRADDLPLWRDADIRYVVVDEFHTYDGAQGTDVAMLLRRLAAATGHAEPGRPLGRICPVATSATLGETAGNTERIREVAEEVFGTPFAADSVIGEQRQAPDDFLEPGRLRPAAARPAGPRRPPRPEARPGRDAAVAAGGHRAGRPVTRGTGGACCAGTSSPTRSSRSSATGRRHVARDPRRPAAQGPVQLGRGVPAVTRRRRPPRSPGSPRCCPIARDPDGDRPFLHVETHLWIRPLSRIVRLISDRPAFGWYGEAAARGGVHARRHAARGAARRVLPALRPLRLDRHLPERDPQDLDADPQKIYRAAVSDKRLVRALIAATRQEAEACAAGAAGRADGPRP